MTPVTASERDAIMKFLLLAYKTSSPVKRMTIEWLLAMLTEGSTKGGEIHGRK